MKQSTKHRIETLTNVLIAVSVPFIVFTFAIVALYLFSILGG